MGASERGDDPDDGDHGGEAGGGEAGGGAGGGGAGGGGGGGDGGGEGRGRGGEGVGRGRGDDGADDKGGEGGDDKDPFGLGLRWSVEPPGLVALFDPQARHRGPPGHLHGGVAATCLDECMAALGMVLDKVHSVTAKLELRYRHPVPLDGRTLRIESWRDDDRKRRVQKVHGHLLLPDGTAAVEATGLFVVTGPMKR